VIILVKPLAFTSLREDVLLARRNFGILDT
jgi:hypothetical protein